MNTDVIVQDAPTTLDCVSGSMVLYKKDSSFVLNGISLEKTIQKAGLFEKVLLYQGGYKEWFVHPDGGVLIKVNHDLWYHNNKPTEYAGDYWSRAEAKEQRKVINQFNNTIRVGKDVIIYDGPFNEWAPNLKNGGIIIRQNHNFYLIVF